mmetsp:Transcript_1598/g.2866  ORF Transcript_1598/g.2866 Transcript_1598/m.2866 type:complete len:1066 (+) Transcript_1598:85-3282(+)
MRRTSVVLAILAVVAFNDAIQSNALRLSSAAPASEKKRPRPQRKRPLRHPFKRSLKSIARAARDGSSTWGDHIASLGRASSSKNRRAKHQSTSMKQSSSIFITKLHKKIQTQQQQQQQQHPKEKQMRPNKTKRYASIEEMIDQNDDYPKEHFVQEILAVVVSGAAATSAFAAVSTGAFIATLAVAVGSVATVLFLDDSDDVLGATLIETIHDDDNDDQEEISEEDCDITGNSDSVAEHKHKILQQHEEPTFQAMKKLTNYTMDELRRCYEGKPKMPLQFSHLRRDRMCIVYTESDESASSEEEKVEYSDNNLLIGDDVVSALEDACSTGDSEKIVPSVDHPKRVNVVWHDPHIADGSNHPIDTVKPSGNDHRRRSQRIIVSDRPSSQQDNEYTESLTDADKEGALLLSQSFRVAASVFGAVADAVRFTGETAAVCTGGTARLAGGVFRLSGFAVNSLGSAIEHGSAKRDRISQAEEPNSGKQRTSKRKAAGENVRLLGESIEQVADSLLLAGSATERVTFAAASIAEGAVRFVGDIAMSMSDMFATESQHALDSGLTPKEKRHMLDIATKESTKQNGLHTDHLDIATTSVINDTTKLDGSSLVESQMNDNDDYNDQSYFFLWAMNNVDDIMADTLGVGSLAPELIGVFVVCYLGSLILLSRQRSKDNRLVEHGKPPEKPSHISVPKEQIRAPHEPFTHDTHNDTDSHTTLTADWTTKVETRQITSSFVKRIAKGIFFVVLSPMKLFVLAAGWFWSLVFNRKSILLLLYSVGFLFLSRSSQYKAAVIKRKSELLGYHNAIESIGQSHVSYLESSMWLNTILHSVWRVSDNTTSDSFGGLEPYLSSFATDSLVESLSGSDKKPNGVAHVSFNSFTLGKTPPMIKGITMLATTPSRKRANKRSAAADEDDKKEGAAKKRRMTKVNVKVDGDLSVAYMRIDVGILMEAELLLDISPSSLDYKMVPTTTLSINSLDTELQLDVSVKNIPSYPFVSYVNVSLSHEIPDFSLRIEPRSQNGLKGVDFGSFPLISKWIKESIVESLHEYVAPNYISIDIPAWLNGDPRIVSYF